MQKTETTMTNSDGFSRCEELDLATTSPKNLSRMQTADRAIKNSVYIALEKDDVLRAVENDQIDVHVKNGTIYLSGHIVNTSTQARIMNAIRTLPGALVIHNDLVLDEKLTLEVAASLAALEHTYDCKFFTGASHGVLSINGVVNNEDIKMLAEKCAADIPNVRGVVNHVRVSGTEPVSQDQPFLQPVLGETIYFLDGVSGVVKQVIINPDNRRVTAITIQGTFNEPRNEIHALVDGKSNSSGQLIVVPMHLVRYLTKVSGFLTISSAEKDQYEAFDPTCFCEPELEWVPPYPYCPDDVIFPIQYQTADAPIAYGPQQSPFQEIVEGASFKKQFFANNSRGG